MMATDDVPTPQFVTHTDTIRSIVRDELTKALTRGQEFRSTGGAAGMIEEYDVVAALLAPHVEPHHRRMRDTVAAVLDKLKPRLSTEPTFHLSTQPPTPTIVTERVTDAPITLGALIDKLAALPPETRIRYDVLSLNPTDFASWRGDYSQLALGIDAGRYDLMTAAKLLKLAQDANGATFQGWKGGDFVMNRETQIWVGNPGSALHSCVVDVVPDPEISEGYALLVTARCDESPGIHQRVLKSFQQQLGQDALERRARANPDHVCDFKFTEAPGIRKCLCGKIGPS
jgi:hypothetical protein